VPLIDGGTWRLPRVVGLGRALDLILTGRAVDAAEALAIGLVTEVAADPLARAVALAHTVAAYPQPTVRSDRASVHAGWGRPVEEALAVEQRLGAAVLGVGMEGAQRFAAGAGRGGEPVGQRSGEQASQ
jgi:enoyl-CoA hydratase